MVFGIDDEVIAVLEKQEKLLSSDDGQLYQSIVHKLLSAMGSYEESHVSIYDVVSWNYLSQSILIYMGIVDEIINKNMYVVMINLRSLREKLYETTALIEYDEVIYALLMRLYMQQMYFSKSNVDNKNINQVTKEYGTENVWGTIINCLIWSGEGEQKVRRKMKEKDMDWLLKKAEILSRNWVKVINCKSLYQLEKNLLEKIDINNTGDAEYSFNDPIISKLLNTSVHSSLSGSAIYYGDDPNHLKLKLSSNTKLLDNIMAYSALQVLGVMKNHYIIVHGDVKPIDDTVKTLLTYVTAKGLFSDPGVLESILNNL